MRRLDRDALRKIIEDSYNEVLVAAIVEAVIARYNARPVKTVAILTGGAIMDIDPILESLGNLSGDGFDMTAVLSKSAEALIGASRLKAVLKSEAVYSEAQLTMEHWTTSELVLLPTLTVNTAAKAAAGICDTPIADMISKSFMMGRMLIANVEGCCPLAKERMDKYRGHIPHAYADMLNANMDRLRDYGLIFTSVPNFERRVREHASTLRSLGRAASVQDFSGKRIISASDVADMPARARLVLRSDAILTHSAQELAESKGIRFTYRDKR